MPALADRASLWPRPRRPVASTAPGVLRTAGVEAAGRGIMSAGGAEYAAVTSAGRSQAGTPRPDVGNLEASATTGQGAMPASGSRRSRGCPIGRRLIVMIATTSCRCRDVGIGLGWANICETHGTARRSPSKPHGKYLLGQGDPPWPATFGRGDGRCRIVDAKIGPAMTRPVSARRPWTLSCRAGSGRGSPESLSVGSSVDGWLDDVADEGVVVAAGVGGAGGDRVEWVDG